MGSPELEVVLWLVGLKTIERFHDPRGEKAPNVCDVAVLLEHLARHVERQIGGVHDTANEPQPRRQDLLALLHDQHRLRIQLQTPGRCAEPELERRRGRDEQQGSILDPALCTQGYRLQWRRPVVRNVTVELGVLLVRNLRLRPIPDRLHSVQGPFLDDLPRLRVRLDVAFIVSLVLGALDRTDDRVGDEVRVALDDRLEGVAVGVVVQTRLFIDVLEVKSDRGPATLPIGIRDVEAALTDRLPESALLFAGATGDDRHFVSHHEDRVKTDPELTDEGRQHARIAVRNRLLQQLPRSGLSDSAEVPDDLVAAHADAAVVDRQRTVFTLRLDADLVGMALGGQIRLRNGLETKPIEGIGGIRDQLSEKDVFGRVKRVDDQVQQT